MRSALFVWMFALLGIGISLQGMVNGSRKALVFDNSGYHLYLPAVFIYHDLGQLSFYPYVDTTYWPTGDIKWYSIYNQPGGRKLNKYAIGSSLFEAPFFLLAHGYTIATKKYPPDGYSLPYEIAVAISYIFWCICGLLLLRKFLRAYYSDTVTLLALASVSLGTNLFYQVLLGGGSHPYEFFLIAAVLYLTQQWHTTYQRKHIYLLGLILGLVLIVRPIDILVAIIPFTWGVCDSATLKNKIHLLYKNLSSITIAAILLLCITAIQMAYWKYTTGNWVHFSYCGERFNFIRPHIINGLFSYRKGWFVYTPMALISMAGFYFLWKQNRKIVLPLFLSLIAAVYLVYSWENWWYGGGFSSRPMVDFLPIAAIPLAALIHYIINIKSLLLKIITATIFIFIITLNLFQTWQYTQGIIHYDRMTGAYYWRIFGKTYYTQEDLQYLMTDKEYWDAMRTVYD